MTESNAFTAARFSAQTDSAYLQILETINIGNIVSCEASISIWQENINTNMQAIAAILDTSDRAWAS